MTPGEDNATVRAEIEQRMHVLAQQHHLEIDLRSLITPIEPFEQAADSELVKLAETLTGHSAEAVAFATEAPFLQQLGMETIVMGPGSIDRATNPMNIWNWSKSSPVSHYCSNASATTASEHCAILPLGNQCALRYP